METATIEATPPAVRGTTIKLPVVPVVAAPKLVMDGQSVQRLAEDMGAVAIPPSALKGLRDLGLEVNQLGRVDTANGYTIATANAVLKFIMLIHQEVNDAEGAMKAHKAVGYLAGQMSKLTRDLKGDTEMTMAPPKGVSNRMFPAGRITQNNFYGPVNTPVPEPAAGDTPIP